MNLSQLAQKGAFIKPGFSLRSVTWKHEGDVITFEVLVKNEMSAADYEFIFLGTGGTAVEKERSYAARRVHRLINLQGEEGPEIIPLEMAQDFKMSLLQALVGAINKVEEEAQAPKNSNPPMSSGTT